MTKLSFFSIPRNKTRKETIEVIKNSLIANGWKFVEKSERSKNKSWVCAEVVQKMSSFSIHFSIHFLRTPQKKRVSDQTPRHRSLIGKGGQLFALVCFRSTHKGFQRIHSTENKGKWNELSATHLQRTFVCSLNVMYVTGWTSFEFVKIKFKCLLIPTILLHVLWKILKMAIL